MINGFDLFNKEVSEVELFYPDLDKKIKDGKCIIAGSLLLKDSEGVLQDKYEIEIHPVREYPLMFPRVFETGCRIPINIDWHVFETDGHCCIRVLPEELLICKKGINLLSFIEKEVKPYFYNQIFRNKFGYYLNERSHGPLGELEFFFEVLRTNDLLQVYKYLAFISKRQEPSRTQNCFCGSGQKYRRCHRESYRKLIEFSDYELKYFTNNIISSKAFMNSLLLPT